MDNADLCCADGVAPRAKMNQQRSRRFRSVQEAKEKDHDREELLKMLMSQNGGKLKDDAKDLTHKKTWDSNAITPGTPFMHTLALCLRYWCAYKINTDTAWEKVGSSVKLAIVMTAHMKRSKLSYLTPVCLVKESTRLWNLFDHSGLRRNIIQTLVM